MFAENKIPTVPEFYEGKTIFITGGTGFIGKVLIEKLLRSCPEIRKIYLLIRPKKGLTPNERIKKMTDLPLFDRLKQEQPKNLTKIEPILGDVCELELGLNPKDRQTLIDQVDIIFNSAASVRFDDLLKTAITSNLRSARELVNLALQMRNLICFVHISTTYCHVDKEIVEEKIYPALADWKEMIEISENSDGHVLNILTQKILNKFPNTYTFTKNLSETLIYDLCNGKIPTIIVRPSIVVSAAFEPIPGWIDNFNGPNALAAGYMKGILRTCYTKNILLEYIAVDIVVKGLILGPWWKQTICKPEKRFKVEVCNASNNGTVPITFEEGYKIIQSINYKYPLKQFLWYPNITITSNWYFFYVCFVFHQLLPAFLVDFALKLSGNNQLRLGKIQQKIFTITKALKYFVENEWIFVNKKGKALEKFLLPTDYNTFSFNYRNVDVRNFFLNAYNGGRKYLLKEDDLGLEEARKKSIKMWYLSKILNLTWYCTIVWFIFFKFDFINTLIVNRKVFK